MLPSITPRLVALSLVSGLVLGSFAAAQQPGPGFRVWGPLSRTETYLMDRNNVVVHTWPSQYLPGASCYLQPDGLLLRSTKRGDSFGPAGDGGGVQRVRIDGTLEWDFVYSSPASISHHDLELLPNGNVLMIAWGARTRGEALAAGRNPAYTPDLIFWPDQIVEVQQTGPTSGQVIWRWDIFDHLIQDFDATKANYGVVADHPELLDINYPVEIPEFGDYNHVNSVDYDPENEWILISAREQDELWIIDHTTTTLEAAGHTGGRRGRGGDLLYRWGNPEAYGRGTPADRKLFAQHAPTFVPKGYPGEGNIIVFNNQSPGTSSIVEIELPLDQNGEIVQPGPGQPFGPAQPVWSYTNPVMVSLNISNAERLPNGNTLVCAGAQGWLFELSPNDQIVWNHVTNLEHVFHAHYYEHYLFADKDEIPLTLGGSVNFELIAGSDHASKQYLVLGSASGTGPGIDVGGPDLLPLVVDSWTMFTLTLPNTYPLANSFGTLDADGRATTTFSLPTGLDPILVGQEFHHAFVVFGQTSGLDLVSNAVPTVLTF